MADDRDLALAKLAVEVGFLSQDEARRYWQQIQAPNAPRLATLLVQEGRLKQGQLDQLRAMYVSRHGTGRVAATATATAPPVATPAYTLPEGNDTSTRAVTADEIWAEALARDRQLAQLLLQRGIVPQERLRECHGIMIQHRMRLGDVLVRKGYADQATVDAFIQQVDLGSTNARNPPDSRSASGRGPMPLRPGTGAQRRPGNGPVPPAPGVPGAGSASGSGLSPISGLAPIGSGLGPVGMGLGESGRGLAPLGLGESARGPSPLGLGESARGPSPLGFGDGGRGPLGSGLSPNPFASVRPGLTPPGLPPNQDDVPTVTEGTPSPLGIGAGLATPLGGVHSAQDSIPTLLDRGGKGGFAPSVDELNPFAQPGAVAPTAAEGLRPPVSIEELNPFGGIPTEPPPGVAPIRPAGAPGTDSNAPTLEQAPLDALGGGFPGGQGWGTGPPVFDPNLPPTQEDTTLPPRYPPAGPPGAMGSSPALGAEHKPAPPVRPAKKRPKQGGGASKVTLAIIALLFLALGLGTVLVLKLVFKVF